MNIIANIFVYVLGAIVVYCFLFLLPHDNFQTYIINGTNITFENETSEYSCRVGVVYLKSKLSNASEVVMLDINGKPLTCSIWKK